MRIEQICKKYADWIQSALAASVFLALVIVLLPAQPPGSGNLPGFEQVDVAERKQAFFDYLRPIAKHHNELIAKERAQLLELVDQESLGWFDKRRIDSLAKKYRVKMDKIDYDDALARLQHRVDVLPESLLLVQAAKESGWGRSRFAREGNALFGEWCFREGCGMVPSARGEGRRHEVRTFRSVYASVGSYMHNLNTHESYADLRAARERMRRQEEKLTGIKLARHLGRYSERGEAYVQEVRSMIRQNELETG